MNKNTGPLVSIIIPCYNQAIYLPEAIESALDQDYPNIEIIVVDDGSLDNTAKVARRYGKKVKLFQQGNKGLSAARNAGIREASGKYILCLDADDRILPSCCRLTARVLNDNSRIGIVASGWRCFGEANYTVIPRVLSFVEQLAINMIPCSSMFRKSDWELIAGFDESMLGGFEDWDFWLRLRMSGRELDVVPKVLLEYRRSKSSMVENSLRNSRNTLHYLHKKHSDLYRKHFDEIHVILYCILHGVLSVRQPMEQDNNRKRKVPARLKYLAKALLPNYMINLLNKAEYNG